ncbi:hypothetical protein Tsubulata_038718 [Turnera subulata]|uniref:DOMON domain-containing protein n=1 Tax=Turnera subulata TaxID=218843 RepID=A0A9Q0EXW2_9ROSI|nr:hypothetical protein Tsubulata_038718 [Turnera subulata]
MASVHCPAMILTLATCAALLVSPSYSHSCTSQKFPSNRTFKNCTDLPELDAHLHFTYNYPNSSLSIAFIAPPARPDGWVSWAINPTSTGMIGAQALMAFSSNGSLTTKTYDISSYSGIQESKLSFEVWDLSAESDGNRIVIYASVKVPAKAETVNQVWQVGPSVAGGRPNMHDMSAANLNARGVLQLVASHEQDHEEPVSSPAPAPVPAPSAHRGGASRIGNRNVAVYVAIALVLLGSSIGFLF